MSWADRGVRVNAIAPGWVPSEMTDGYFAARRSAVIVSQQPAGRVGDPSELIGSLLFLASGASSYVDGQTIAVDGGMSASYGAPQWGLDIRPVRGRCPDGLGTPITPSE